MDVHFHLQQYLGYLFTVNYIILMVEIRENNLLATSIA